MRLPWERGVLERLPGLSRARDGRLVLESEQTVEERGDSMELFEPILGITMMVIGLVMVLGGMGVLFYSVSIRDSTRSQGESATNSQVRVEPL